MASVISDMVLLKKIKNIHLLAPAIAFTGPCTENQFASGTAADLGRWDLLHKTI